MLIAYALPELQSSVPYLQATACWAYGQFFNLEFADTYHLNQIIEGLYHSLFSQNLPVRYSAAIALTQLLRNKAVEPIVKPVLNQVLEKFLQITAEMDSEKLISSLEEIMSVYREDIVPFANQICSQLVEQFMKQIANNEDPDAFCAAIGTISALRKVLESSQKQPLVL